MPRVSGKSLISETTEKVIRRTFVVSSAVILTKLYDVPLNDLKALGMELPSQLIDTVLLVLVIFHVYSLIINWVGDLAAFRLWFQESSIWSEFGSNIKLDSEFLRGGIPLLLRLHEIEKNREWPTDYSKFDEKVYEEYDSFKNNVDLYICRLEGAGTKFKALSFFGHYYVWFQSFIFPIAISIYALYLLVSLGGFVPPSHI